MNSIMLSADQFGIVYNVLSFGLVSMLACTIYTLVSQSRVLPKYRTALVMSRLPLVQDETSDSMCDSCAAGDRVLRDNNCITVGTRLLPQTHST